MLCFCHIDDNIEHDFLQLLKMGKWDLLLCAKRLNNSIKKKEENMKNTCFGF